MVLQGNSWMLTSRRNSRYQPEEAVAVRVQAEHKTWLTWLHFREVGGFGARFAAPFCRKHQSCVHCQGLLKHTVFQQRLNGPFQPNCWEDHCEIFRISFLLILTQTTKPSCENWSLHRSTLHSLLLESTGTRFKPLQFLLIQSYSQARNIPVDYKKQKTKHWGKIKHLTLKLIYCHSTVLELATRKATRTL